MTRLKKWQKIVILLVLIVGLLIGSIVIFKKPILSALLSDQEMAIYDCCCKTRRVAKYENYQVDDFALFYQSDTYGNFYVLIYSIKNDRGISCTTVFKQNNVELNTFAPILYNKDTISSESYFIDRSLINSPSDKYIISNETNYMDGSNICISGYDIYFLNDKIKKLKEGQDEYGELYKVGRFKAKVINLFSY